MLPFYTREKYSALMVYKVTIALGYPIAIMLDCRSDDIEPKINTSLPLLAMTLLHRCLRYLVVHNS